MSINDGSQWKQNLDKQIRNSSLDPLIDKHGTIRVGGKLGKSFIKNKYKRLIMLSKDK